MKRTTTKNSARKVWTDADVDAVLTVYGQFLKAQQAGEKYSKAAAVREVAAKLERSKGSVECKMMNISECLRRAGCEYVTGYKPLANINAALVAQVAAWMKQK